MFSARRKPKRIASSEPQDGSDQTQSRKLHSSAHPSTTCLSDQLCCSRLVIRLTNDVTEPNTEEDGPVVRRPTTAPKQKSKLRMTFEAEESTEDGTSQPQVQNARRVGASALSRAPVQLEDREPDRPSYSKNYLEELKGSTPTTPQNELANISGTEKDAGMALIQPQTQALDIASKFGGTAVLPSAIPSAAEIAEKKARRERLAKEASASALTSTEKGTGSVKNNDDYVSLDAYDSDGEFKPSRMQVSTYLQKDRADNEMEYSRLVPEDEDIAEGFEQFVEDDAGPGLKSRKNGNRINMTTKSDPHADRDAMRRMIETAEGGGDESDDSDEASEASDASAEHAYMTAQTRHGAGFSHLSKEDRRRQEKEAQRPRQPDKTTPIPTLASGVGRLRELKEQALLRKQSSEKRREEILRRLSEIKSEKERIQTALDDLGRQLEETDAKVAEHRQDNGIVHRGLDSIGAQ